MYNGNLFWSKKKQSVIKIRAKILHAAHTWLTQQGYTEVHGPTLIPATEEWPNYFTVNYYGKKAYLSQSLQPYADVFTSSFKKIYTIAPVFRAEKHTSPRHLAEYWRIEVTAKNCDLNTIIEIQEKLTSNICHHLANEAKKELKLLGRKIQNIEKIEPPFPQISYDEAIELLEEEGTKIFWGENLTWEHERKLSLKFAKPFFIKNFPIGFQTFFYKSHSEKKGSTLTADLLAPEGYGELSSGGQFINKKNVLLKKMNEEEIENKSQQWYLSLKTFESAPKSGFMIGLERLISWICKLENIEEASAFPRSFDKIYP